MVARKLSASGAGAIVRLGPIRPAMVIPQVGGVHAERAIAARYQAFPQARPARRSELRNKLRPDRDHADKQRNRRQRRRFLDENPQHPRLLTTWNITGTLFSFCSGSQGTAVPNLEIRPGWLIATVAPDQNPRACRV